MEHHICQLPSAQIEKTFTCRECRWRWRVNTTVMRWFRDAPDDPR